MDNSLVVTDQQLQQNFEFFKKINEYKEKTLTEEIDYYFRDKKLIYKRSGWSKIALFFNITFKILKEKEQSYTDEKTGKRIYIFDFTARAILPNGRSNDDTGSCESNEPDKVFKRRRHDVRSTATTRAKARAISGIIGAGIMHEELPDQPKKNITRKQLKKNIK